MLKFLGRGDTFSREQTCAFFSSKKTFVLIDCPLSAMEKIRAMSRTFEYSTKIIVLLTSIQSDHAGGLGTFIKYINENFDKEITVIIPSRQAASHIIYLLSKIEMCPEHAYKIICLEHGVTIKLYESEDGMLRETARPYDITINEPWFIAAIKTSEEEQYGYKLSVDNDTVIFTGSTSNLDIFAQHINPGSIIYTGATYANRDSCINIYDAIKYLDYFKRQKNTKSYLMYLDEEAKIDDLVRNSDITLVRVYDPRRSPSAYII